MRKGGKHTRYRQRLFDTLSPRLVVTVQICRAYMRGTHLDSSMFACSQKALAAARTIDMMPELGLVGISGIFPSLHFAAMAKELYQWYLIGWGVLG